MRTAPPSWDAAGWLAWTLPSGRFEAEAVRRVLAASPGMRSADVAGRVLWREHLGGRVGRRVVSVVGVGQHLDGRVAGSLT
jgi:hypothetical protein